MKLNGLMWWINRWRKSSAYVAMNVEQQGAYRNLLDEATLRGGRLPNDEETLARACGDPRVWKRVRSKVLQWFTLGPDGWRNDTLDEVLRETHVRLTKERTRRLQARQHVADKRAKSAGDQDLGIKRDLAN
jgi:uncharacterized protein YdaU (DUF1376 family)